MISCTPLCARRSTALVLVSISGEEKNSGNLPSFLPPFSHLSFLVFAAYFWRSVMICTTSTISCCDPTHPSLHRSSKCCTNSSCVFEVTVSSSRSNPAHTRAGEMKHIIPNDFNIAVSGRLVAARLRRGIYLYCAISFAAFAMLARVCQCKCIVFSVCERRLFHTSRSEL